MPMLRKIRPRTPIPVQRSQVQDEKADIEREMLAERRETHEVVSTSLRAQAKQLILQQLMQTEILIKLWTMS